MTKLQLPETAFKYELRVMTVPSNHHIGEKSVTHFRRGTACDMHAAGERRGCHRSDWTEPGNSMSEVRRRVSQYPRQDPKPSPVFLSEEPCKY